MKKRSKYGQRDSVVFFSLMERRSIAVPPYDNTVIEMRLKLSITDAQERFQRNKRPVSLQDANAGINIFFRNMFDMYVPSYVLIYIHTKRFRKFYLFYRVT